MSINAIINRTAFTDLVKPSSVLSLMILTMFSKKPKIEEVRKSFETRVSKVQTSLNELQLIIDRSKEDWQAEWKTIDCTQASLYEIISEAYATGNAELLGNLNSKVDVLQKYVTAKYASAISTSKLQPRDAALMQQYARLVAAAIKSEAPLTGKFESLRAKMFPGSVPNQELPKNVSEYVSEVRAKFLSVPPRYDPAGGGVIEDKRWLVETNKTRTRVRGYYNTAPVELALSYAPAVSEDAMLESAENARAAGKCVVECFAASRAPRSVRTLIANFDTNAYTPLLYIIDPCELVYNRRDARAEFFKGYFIPRQIPLSLESELEKLADANGLVDKSRVMDKLGIGIDGFHALQRMRLVTADSEGYKIWR